jgi:3-isopropylmalate dehydrogenase
MSFRLVLLPGDGVGPEVIDAGVIVLRAVEQRFQVSYETARHPIGGAALSAGQPALPESTLAACMASDAVLLGAVGDPRFDHLPREQRVETGLLALRKSLNVYANLRPAQAWTALDAVVPFKPDRIAGANLVIVRELLGGLYFGEPRKLEETQAYNTMRYSVPEIERIADVAFRLAAGRRKRVTSVDKHNVLETSQLWRRVVTHVAQRYPDVQLDHQYVDACAMNLALDPRRFDVILTENLFGDILSDEAGAIAGSLGMLPSASIGDGPGLYEPVHGSAPTLAGKDVANPIGTILSIAMLLRHAAKSEPQAVAIERAVESALTDGCRTQDIAEPGRPPLSCRAMATEIARRVASGA